MNVKLVQRKGICDVNVTVILIWIFKANILADWIGKKQAPHLTVDSIFNCGFHLIRVTIILWFKKQHYCSVSRGQEQACERVSAALVQSKYTSELMSDCSRFQAFLNHFGLFANLNDHVFIDWQNNVKWIDFSILYFHIGADIPLDGEF